MRRSLVFAGAFASRVLHKSSGMQVTQFHARHPVILLVSLPVMSVRSMEMRPFGGVGELPPRRAKTVQRVPNATAAMIMVQAMSREVPSRQ